MPVELLAAAGGAFLGALGIRLADALRANLQLRTARLAALEGRQTAVEARAAQCEADMVKLGTQANGLVTGLYGHDNELARLAFKLDMARDSSPLDPLALGAGPAPEPRIRQRGR